MKKCSKCKICKDISSFGKKSYNKDGLNHYCKECENARGKNFYHKKGGKTKVKFNSILRNYGLNKDQYLKKFENQQYRCSICSKALKIDKNSHIDHNHETGQIRDILCNSCNFILGIIEINILKIENFMGYIDKHSLDASKETSKLRKKCVESEKLLKEAVYFIN